MQLTQQELKTELRYEAETGNFFWLKRKQGRSLTNAAGTTDKVLGYKLIMVNGHKHYSHRLAWLYENGEFPSLEIDHINRVKTDNTIDNLRDVSHEVNQGNRG